MLGLLLTMPAGLVVDGARGTIWNGRAVLSAGHVMAWRWSPWYSITHPGFGVEWRMEGAQTDLAGRASLMPGRIKVRDLAGQLDMSELFASVPDLPFACAMAGRVDAPRADYSQGQVQGEGRIDLAAGTCRVRADEGRAHPVPPMQLYLTPARTGGVTVRLQSRDGKVPLLDGEVGDGVFSYRLSARGARVLPFAAPSGAGERVEIAF